MSQRAQSVWTTCTANQRQVQRVPVVQNTAGSDYLQITVTMQVGPQVGKNNRVHYDASPCDILQHTPRASAFIKTLQRYIQPNAQS
jgi:hypothetical protein